MNGKMLGSPLSTIIQASAMIHPAKDFERIIYDQLYVDLTKYNLLSKHQSGFPSLHSTVTALLEATIDLKKAF